MKRIGKIGKINIEANRILFQKFREAEIDYCELKFQGCLKNWLLQFCHKEKREWYRGKPELLSDLKHVILGCQNCHEILDNRAKTTKEKSDNIFKGLRINY